MKESCLDEIRKKKEAWEKECVQPVREVVPERESQFKTLSDITINALYAPDDINFDYLRDLGFPGQYPFTRGVQPTGYRGKLWTRRQVAGYHTPGETNKRLKYLIEQGQTGLNLVVDMPTWFGLDPDDELAEGEVGKEGVPVSSLQDMEEVLDGIPLERVSTSLITSGTALTAMYFAIAEKQGVPLEKLQGTTQNDVLLLFHSSNIFNLPLELNMRLVADVTEFTCKHVPRWNPISISGYNTRESGCSAVQEIAFAIGDAIAYINSFLERELKIDRFAPRISFFLSGHNNFFEEIAKYRAMRRMWAKLIRERYGSANPKSWLMRFHTQTAGSTLTAQHPYNNIVRSTIQGLAAVLGGTQSLHINSFDEALGLPTEESARISLHTQLIMVHESGVADTIDPLGGSYFIESLTNQLEEAAWALLKQIEEEGGMVKASLSGWVQKQKAQYVRNYYSELKAGRRTVVGLNAYQPEEQAPVRIFKPDPVFEQEQVERVQSLRKNRDNEKVKLALKRLSEVVRAGENTMESTIEAVKAYATLGEIHAEYRKLYGGIKEPSIHGVSVFS